MGPPLQPLDFASLMHSHEATHTQLARTVEDLAQWLSVVEFGLTQMLEKASEDTIEEEQEQEDSPGNAYAFPPPGAGLSLPPSSALVAED